VTTYRHALHALSDPTRRDILEALVKRPQAVGELAESLPVSRPAVSQHLKVLKVSGLVRETRHGTRRIYNVEVQGIVELRRYLDALWTNALGAFESAVDLELRSTQTRAGVTAHSNAGRRAKSARTAGSTKNKRRTRR